MLSWQHLRSPGDKKLFEMVLYVNTQSHKVSASCTKRFLNCIKKTAGGQICSVSNCRIKGCGGAGCPPPPPIIFERLKLPQQIIYRRKENLSESPNHQKYWENILVSRFYEQFSRNRRNLGHFRKFEKISNS